MGFGTNLYTWIYFSRDTFTSITQVKDAIDECSTDIDYVKKQISALALMTEPGKMLPEDERDDPSGNILRRVDNLVEELEDLFTRRSNLYLLEREWDRCHDEQGRAITFPEGCGIDDMSFIDGDFIDSVHMVPADKDGSKADKTD